jgi:hypothetical protein
VAVWFCRLYDAISYRFLNTVLSLKRLGFLKARRALHFCEPADRVGHEASPMLGANGGTARAANQDCLDTSRSVVAHHSRPRYRKWRTVRLVDEARQ